MLLTADEVLEDAVPTATRNRWTTPPLVLSLIVEFGRQTEPNIVLLKVSVAAASIDDGYGIELTAKLKTYY